ncbi:Neuroligin-1 [Aphelenchoides besseyi]|nr:Neuroligin-1 [Aphelenchoides besseyi]
MLRYLLVYLFCTSTVFANLPPSHARRSVTTSFGVLRGETISLDGSDLPAVTQFLGIPYGLSPTGQYRFGMAVSAAKWTNQPKDAFKNPSVCIQSGFNHQSETEALKVTSAQRFDFTHRILPFLKPEAEDCLYLNIYVPERLERNSANLMSALVIVHGGEFGAGNAFNGSVLAANGQIVVVTVNYRIDIYGFLGRCESNSCIGNAGMSDLVAALKMLSNILPAFGADSQSITLLGWGSGASLVSLLMASPITQPKNRLFKRAILLDGTALSPWAMTDQPQQYFMRIAQELQCINIKKAKDPQARQDLFQKHTAQLTRCLQEQSQLNVTSAARKIKAPTFMSAFAPIVDGQIVPNHPKFSFSPKFGALFRDIDLLVGTVTHPAHFLLPNTDLNEGVTVEKRDRILRTLVRNLFDYHRSEIFDGIINEYTDWESPKQKDSKTIRDSLLHALNDVLYVAPLIETLRAHSTDEAPKVSNTYFFVFGHETRAWSAEQPSSGLSGAFSDDHIAYILGYPLVANNEEHIYTRFNEFDAGISKVLMRYVSNFVKSGDPSKPQTMSTQSTVEDRYHGVPWPEYSQASRESYLEITDKPRVKNYYRNAQVGFWSQYVPKLNRGNKERSVQEEHHFLPDHFNRQTFYGVVRPYSSFHNEPFPPPPSPPTAFPKDIRKPSTTTTPPTAEKTTSEVETKKTENVEASLSTTWPYFAIVFLALIVINACCCIAFFRKYLDSKQGSKKPVHYQSYMSHAPTADLAYNISSTPLNQQSFLPTTALITNPTEPTPGTAPQSRHASLNETSRTSSFAFEASLNSLRQQHLPQYHQMSGFTTAASTVTSPTTPHAPLFNGFNAEQEPLLAASSKSSTPAAIRSGISPTCPRHGRAAQLLANSSRANSIGSTLAVNHNNNNSTTLEEVQV